MSASNLQEAIKAINSIDNPGDEDMLSAVGRICALNAIWITAEFSRVIEAAEEHGKTTERTLLEVMALMNSINEQAMSYDCARH